MSKHTAFRLMMLIQDALELLDLDPEGLKPLSATGPDGYTDRTRNSDR